MRDFCRFYQEYVTRSINEPFIGNPPKAMLLADFSQVDYWRRIGEDKGRLTLEDYAPYVMRYYPLAAKYLQGVPAQFSHGHLFPDHVFKSDDRSYILIDHLSWRYRFKWTDLTMNIWNAWMGIRDTSFSGADLIKYVEKWKSMYLEMPVVKGERDFEQIFYALMLNRCVGTITADLGGAPLWGEKENEIYRKHLVTLMQQLFDYLEKKLKESGKGNKDHEVLRR